jgi:hypothetical protein
MDYRQKFLVEPGEKVHLSKIDPSYAGKHKSHEDAAPNWTAEAIEERRWLRSLVQLFATTG